MTEAMRLLCLLALLLLPALLTERGAAQYEWNQRALLSPPGARGGHAVAYDAARRRTVLFGGAGSNGIALSDTWEWDGTRWTRSFPAQSPPPRSGCAMAYDSGRGRVVLFGGRADSGLVFGDTWEWDGANWSPRFPALFVIPRERHALAHDARRGRTVLFGGFNGGSYFDDTLEWDGTNWIAVGGPVRPPARLGHGLAFDPVRAVTVLFGGSSSASGNLADTWEWDGTQWLVRAPPAAPLARSGPGMAHDTARGRTVLYGGRDAVSGFFYQDVWEWDGTTWARVFTWLNPTRRIAHNGLAYDSARARSILYGGPDQNGVLGDTWELVVPCFSVGPGHATGSLSLSCDTPPRLGTTFCLSFVNAPLPGIAVLVLDATCQAPPLSLDPPLTCTRGFLHALPAFSSTATGSPARFCLPVPSTPGLEGATLCVQGASVEPAGCLRLTDGVRVTLVQ